jgi:hypothetical protein
MQRGKVNGFMAFAVLLFAFSTQAASAQTSSSPLVGFWSCSGQNPNITLVATYEYRADGTYVSTQEVTGRDFSFSGGGGGTWRYENGILGDTKLRGDIDRFVMQGEEITPDDDAWHELYRQSQSNIGVTTTGAVRIEDDVAYAGGLTCHRQR